MKHAIIFFAVVFCLVVDGAAAYAAPQGGQHGRTQENNVKAIGKFFDKADANHDGMLAREEAEKIPISSNQFNNMDINQDGKVTRQEMAASIKMEKRHHGHKADNFYWYAEGMNVIFK